MPNRTAGIAVIATFLVNCQGPATSLDPTSVKQHDLNTFVSVHPDSVSMVRGEVQTFVLVFHPGNGDSIQVGSNEVDWVATGGEITPDGSYIADSLGVFMVAASYNGLTDTSSVEVRPPTPVGIRVSPDSARLESRDRLLFSAVLWDSRGNMLDNQPVTWAASGGTIDTAGYFESGDAPGEFVVVVKHESGITDTASVSIVPLDETSVRISPSQASMFPGDSMRFVANLDSSTISASNLPLNWWTSGGHVNDAGWYFASAGPGAYVVVASIQDGPADTAQIAVLEPVLTSVTMDVDTVSVRVATSYRFSALCSDQNHDPLPCRLSWTATGGEIDDEGMFTASTVPGDFRIVAEDSVTSSADTAFVTIKPGPPSTITLSPQDVQLEPSDPSNFGAVVEDEFGNRIPAQVQWGTDGGTIDSVGHFVAGRQAGPFVITAGYEGLADTSSGEIIPPKATSILITPSQLTIEPLATVGFSATVSDKHGQPFEASVEWSVTAGEIDLDGIFLAGVTRGEAIVIATHEVGLADTAQVTVAAPSTWLYPGEDLAAAVAAHPAGTQFLFKAGLHRLQTISPKAGNIFVGEENAVLSGARALTSFTREGSYWVVGGQTQQGQQLGTCNSQLTNEDGTAYTGCRHPEDLFIDDQPLFQVSSLSEVQPGKWFFDYDADKVYIADDPFGRKVEISVIRSAFVYSADNVTIRNLIVEKYANPAQYGAIHAVSPDNLGNGWVIENVEVRLNHGTGIKVGLSGTRIVGSNIHHNGQLGIGLLGANNVVEDNTITFNNTAGFSPAWEGGGTKFVRTSDLIVRRNTVTNNMGPGLWTDTDNLNTLYEDNIVVDNAWEGIFHEASYDAIIRNNTVENNGFQRQNAWLYGAGILVAHSPNVEVYGNIVTNNTNGIAAIEQDRGDGVYGPYVIENLWVHDNTITMTIGQTGLAQDVGDAAIFTTRNNRFDGNVYLLGPSQNYFAFDDGSRTFVQWQAYGQDVNGTEN